MYIVNAVSNKISTYKRRFYNSKFIKSFASNRRNKYNITSSNVYKYTYFRIGKTGTRSLLDALIELTSPEINGYHQQYISKAQMEYFKFTIIRNPWDRVVSAYSDKVIGKLLFEECWDKDFNYFVKYLTLQNLNIGDGHLGRQVKLFPLKDIDYIGKFENLSNEFEIICNRIGINAELPHKNASRHKKYIEFYNDNTRRIVERLYKDDILLGKYTFGD